MFNPNIADSAKEFAQLWMSDWTYQKIVSDYGTDKIIIIGSNNSVTIGNFGEYIDNSDCPVVRVNRIAEKKYISNYGSKTDCLWTFDELRSSGGHPRYVFRHHDGWIKAVDNITKVYNVKNKYATTGFMFLLICINIFKNIELFGYGLSRFILRTTPGATFNCHDIRLEDRYIHKFITDIYKGRVIRGEESHPEILIRK